MGKRPSADNKSNGKDSKRIKFDNAPQKRAKEAALKAQKVKDDQKAKQQLVKAKKAEEAAKQKAKLAQIRTERISHERKSAGKQKQKQKAPIVQIQTEYITDKLTIIAGSYERLLYGLEATARPDSDQLDLKPIFQFPAHLSCVKSCSASPAGGKVLVTGAADEVIKVWDLRRRKEIGGLAGHEGTLHALTFSSSAYMVSASADGTLGLFRTKDWSLLRKFKGHKGRVNDVSVHPQGRVALSVGQDRCLRMWDLLGKGGNKAASSTKLGMEGDKVCWHPSGDRFIVICDRTLRVYSTDMSLLHELSSKSRFHDAVYYENEGKSLLLVACEDGKVRVFDDSISPLQQKAEFVGHTNRIKSISLGAINADAPRRLAVTISSDSKIHVYELSSLHSLTEDIKSIEPIGSHDTQGSRLTCLCTASVMPIQSRPQGSLLPESDDEDTADDSDLEDELSASGEDASEEGESDAESEEEIEMEGEPEWEGFGSEGEEE